MPSWHGMYHPCTCIILFICCAPEPFLLLADHMGATFSDFPHVKQYVERVKGRKAVVKALQLHKEAGMPQKDLFGGAV